MSAFIQPPPMNMSILSTAASDPHTYIDFRRSLDPTNNILQPIATTTTATNNNLLTAAAAVATAGENRMRMPDDPFLYYFYCGLTFIAFFVVVRMLEKSTL